MIIKYDENKRRRNLKDHGIDFAEMADVFDKPLVSKVDNRIDYGETRLIALGELNGGIIIFVYTVPVENTARMISVRKATKKEAKIYYRRVYG